VPPTATLAEQADCQAVIAHLRAQTARYLDTAALFEAFGGGSWNRGESSNKL